jgi:cytochrome c oxidase assembly protein subunit 15
LITLLLTAFTLLVVTVGAYTRLSDAGLGCPDWPGCFGSMIVPSDTVEKDKAWIEMIHRYIAGTLGLGIFALTLMAYLRKPVIEKIRGLLTFTSVLIIFQAALGMWTVTKLLHPTIVMLHLLGGMATLSLVWLAHLRLQNPPTQIVRPTFSMRAKIAAIVALIIVVLQIALGGWVSTNYAAFACPDFPTCQASFWPTLDWNAFNIFIPIDRNFEGGFLGAVVTAAYLFIVGGVLYRSHPEIRTLIIGLWSILLLQIGLGIINVVALLPMWAAVLHNGVAAILLLFIVTLNYRVLETRP